MAKQYRSYLRYFPQEWLGNISRMRGLLTELDSGQISAKAIAYFQSFDKWQWSRCVTGSWQLPYEVIGIPSNSSFESKANIEDICTWDDFDKYVYISDLAPFTLKTFDKFHYYLYWHTKIGSNGHIKCYAFLRLTKNAPISNIFEVHPLSNHKHIFLISVMK